MSINLILSLDLLWADMLWYALLCEWNTSAWLSGYTEVVATQSPSYPFEV